MPSRSLLLTALDTSGETCRGWTGEQMLFITNSPGIVRQTQWTVWSLLCFRPLCASGMDKLQLQDCLDHGRVAKVGHVHVKRNISTCRYFVLDWRRVCCLVVWKGAHHHYSLQLHQTGERPALPRADEREGGHPVVHRAGEVSGHTRGAAFGRYAVMRSVPVNVLTTPAFARSSFSLCTKTLNISLVFSPLQDLWFPRPLHWRVQHGSRRPAEAPGPVLERPRHQASVRSAQRLLCLWIRRKPPSPANTHTPAFSSRAVSSRFLPSVAHFGRQMFGLTKHQRGGETVRDAAWILP